jgi:hypothetical protein
MRQYSSLTDYRVFRAGKRLERLKRLEQAPLVERLKRLEQAPLRWFSDGGPQSAGQTENPFRQDDSTGLNVLLFAHRAF